VLSPENMACFEDAMVFWLSLDVDEVHRRFASDPKTAAQRPKLSGLDERAELVATLAKRAPLYERYSDFTIDCSNKDVQAVVEEVLTLISEKSGQGG